VEEPPSPYQPRPTPQVSPNDKGGPGLEQPGFSDTAPTAPLPIDTTPARATSAVDQPASTETPEPAATVTPGSPENMPKIISGKPSPQPEPALLAACRAVLERRRLEDLELLNKMDMASRELLLGLLSLAECVGEGKLAQVSPEEIAGTLKKLNELAAQLRLRAPLVLDKLFFCQDIKAFGVYDPYVDRDHPHAFQAGIGGKPGERVQVYVEVRNFTSTHKNGYYETCLDSTLEIKEPGEKGHVVCRMDFPANPDRSLTARQDFFLAFRFHVPPRMPPGDYTLWVIVREKPTEKGQGERAVRKSIDFRVNPDSAPPSQRTAGLP